jgi:colicin import membrane protein/apoptotic chromatin condensation inducer in the nucleus
MRPAGRFIDDGTTKKPRPVTPKELADHEKAVREAAEKAARKAAEKAAREAAEKAAREAAEKAATEQTPADAPSGTEPKPEQPADKPARK